MTAPVGGERRRTPGSFITMDAAMLAAQNERLDTLNHSIEELAKAIDARPTRAEIERTRRKNRLKIGLTAFFVTAIAVVLAEQQISIDRQQAEFQQTVTETCLDRNSNSVAFTTLLAEISRINGLQAEGPIADQYAAAFARYVEVTRPIDCNKYLQ